MKKILCMLMAFGMCLGITGCSNGNENKEEKAEEKQPEAIVSDLDVVGKIFTFETSDSDGTMLGIAKDGDLAKFKMYLAIGDKDKEIASAMNISVGTLIYSTNGSDSETYHIDNNSVYFSAANTTPESMKNSMDAYLNEKGITLDQLKNAMKEQFGI